MYFQNRKNYALIEITILIVWMIILWVIQYIKTWYLPDPLKNATLVYSFGVPDTCGGQLFGLDKSTSETISKYGVSYLNNNPSNLYVKWRKTPVVKEMTALRGFGCNKEFGNSTFRLIRKEIKYDRGYYTVADNNLSAVFIFPELSIVLFVYYDT